MSRWDLEFQLRTLSLAKQQLKIIDKNYVNCIRIDPSKSQLYYHYLNDY